MFRKLVLIAALSFCVQTISAPHPADALFFKDAWGSFKDKVKKAAKSTKAWVKKAGKAVKKAASKVGKKVKKAAASAKRRTKSWWKQGKRRTKSRWSRAKRWMKDKWKRGKRWVKKTAHKILNKIHFRKLIPLPKDGTSVLPCSQTENHNQCVGSDRCGYCLSTRTCLPLSSTACKSGWYQKDPLRSLDSANPAPPLKPSVAPIGSPAARTQIYSPAGSLDIKGLVGKAYENIRKMLGAMIPGAVRDVLVDGFIIRKWRQYQPKLKAAFARLGLPPPPANFKSAISAAEKEAPADRTARYYIARAEHARPDVSKFVGIVPFVRVTLPDRAADFTVQTAAGTVVGSDHMIRNRWNTAFKAYPAERVEIITPARRAGGRFGAIAIYLAYRKRADRLPAYYILEAGVAQGGARVNYVSHDMKGKYWVSGYVPTNLSSSKNIYRGTLVMDGNEIKRLLIEVWKGDPRTDKSAKNYADVNIDFDRVPATDKRLRRTGAEMFREAVVRNAAISEAMGKKMKDLSILNGLFAREGRHTVEWVVRPK